MEVKRIKIFSVVEGGVCVSVADGQRVYDQIHSALQAGDKVLVSFNGVVRITTAFLNTAIGQLYNDFGEDVIRRNVALEDLDSSIAEMVTRVVGRAKRFFREREKANKSTTKMLEE